MTSTIKSAASIVITLDFSGNACLESIFMGRHDATYRQMDDAKLVEREIPKLLTELRSQIQSAGNPAKPVAQGVAHV